MEEQNRQLREQWERKRSIFLNPNISNDPSTPLATPYTANDYSWNDFSDNEEENFLHADEPPKLKVRLWTSPYRRARQTA